MELETANSLADGPVTLRFETCVEPEGDPQLVPYYHFSMLNEDGYSVGHINLRVGDTNHIRCCAGHIGYAVKPEFRGQRYAYHACRALVPVIKHVYRSVLVTSDLENTASISAIERLGAAFLDVSVVPQSDPGYQFGARKKVRYQWLF